VSREEQKREAIERMKSLRLHENVLREFENENKLNLSENGGILFWLDEKQEAEVRAFEAKREAVVYHVIHSYTEFGELLAMLYVSKSSHEWEYDREDLKQGYPYAYVKNFSGGSEIGVIGIKSQNGGLVRTE